MKIQIKTTFGDVRFEGDFESLAAAVVTAVESGANLSGANLYGANLYGAKDAALAVAQTRILPAGDLIGWKKCVDGHIVKLSIPADAKRSHAFGRKCRAEWANVLEIVDAKGEALKETKSDRGGIYKTGKRVAPDSWDDNWQNECAGGIHFFITREEAEAYTP